MKTENNNIYDGIPNEYSIDEKNEIVRLINEYADICISILEHKQDDIEDK